MMVVTAKVKKKNLLIIGAAILAIILILVLPGRSKNKEMAGSEIPGSSDQERVNFLSSFGWNVENVPEETGKVRVPENGNEVFTRYNELQKSQGFDLTQYAGKILNRYVYRINSGSDDTHLRATVFVLDGRIVGGDISSDEAGGRMHGFRMP